MEREELLQKHCALLKTISSLPRKIINLSGADNTSSFVLQELCSKDCFNLSRAAYFIDNPDFNCLKGVAGYSEPELASVQMNWESPDQFTEQMKLSAFNNLVRSTIKESYKKKYGKNHIIVDDLVCDLGFNDPSFCVWQMKHDNHGLLIYDKQENKDTFVDDHLMDALFLLSFCPVY